MDKVEIKDAQKEKKIFQEDASKVANYVGEQIKNQLKDQFKNGLANIGFMIMDTVSNGLKNMIQITLFNGQNIQNYQRPSNAPYSQGGYYAYEKQYTMPNRYAQNAVQTPQDLYSRNVYSYENIEFTTEAEANYVLQLLKNEIRRRGYVEVAALYREAKLQWTYADLDWGWNNLESVRTQRKMNGKWILLMPKAIEISKD
jgi:hypothetical protein